MTSNFKAVVLGWLAALMLATLLLTVHSGARAAEVQPIPRINLDNLDASVRDALQAAIQEFERFSAQTDDPDSLGRAYGVLGRWFHAHGQIEPALVSYRNALALAGDDPDWLYLVGILKQGQGQFDQARTYFSRSLERNPLYVPALIRRARINLDAGDLEAAEQDLEQALIVRPVSAAAIAEMGRLALEQGDAGQAVQRLTRALELDPGANQLHAPLAIAYRNLGDMDKASEHRERSGSIAPAIADPVLAEVRALSRSSQLYFESGIEAVNRGNVEQGLELLRRAVELNPEDDHYLEVLARQLFEASEYEQAEAHFEQLLELDPDKAVAHYYLGRIAMLDGRGAEAQGRFEQALMIVPDNGNLENWRARSLMAQGDFDRAADHYRALAAARTGEDRVYALYWQGMALIGAGHCGAATGPLESALRESEQLHGWALLALARVHAACPEYGQADPEQALAWAARLYDINHGVETAATMAMVYAALGDFEEAIGLQAEALFAATGQEHTETWSELNRNMARYREDEPAPRPYSPDDPVFTGQR